MTGDNLVEIPCVNLRDTLVEAGAIGTACCIPYKPLLARGSATSMVERCPYAGKNTGCGRHTRFAELLGGREIEEEICLDESFVGLVVEHYFLVHVTVHELVVEIGIELWVDRDGIFVLFCKDNCEGNILVLLLCAFLR